MDISIIVSVIKANVSHECIAIIYPPVIVSDFDALSRWEYHCFLVFQCPLLPSPLGLGLLPEMLLPLRIFILLRSRLF